MENIMRMFIIFVLPFALLSPATSKIVPETLNRRIVKLEEQFSRLDVANTGIIVLDGDNIRGKTRFSLTKENLFTCVEKWALSLNLQGRVCLLYDHASSHVAFYKPQSGVAIVFSGSKLKADDVIARDISFHQRYLKEDVILITEDSELKKRCRTNSISSSNSKRKLKKKQSSNNIDEISVHDDRKVTMISSPPFADLMKHKFCCDRFANPSSSDFNGNANISTTELLRQRALLERETDLRSKLDKLRRLLQETMRKQRRSSYQPIMRKIQIVQKQIYDLAPHGGDTNSINYQSFDQSETKVDDEKSISSNEESRDSSRNDYLIRGADIITQSRESTLSSERHLSHVSSPIQRSDSDGRGHVEETWERVILAEKLRQDLMLQCLQTNDVSNIQSTDKPAATEKCTPSSTSGNHFDSVMYLYDRDLFKHTEGLGKLLRQIDKTDVVSVGECQSDSERESINSDDGIGGQGEHTQFTDGRSSRESNSFNDFPPMYLYANYINVRYGRPRQQIL